MSRLFQISCLIALLAASATAVTSAATIEDVLDPVAEPHGFWVDSSWLGQVWTEHFPWVHRSDLGWLYILPGEASSNVYLPTRRDTSQSGGQTQLAGQWLYMSADLGPYAYYYDLESWIHWAARETSYSWFYALEDWVDLTDADLGLTLDAIAGVRIAEVQLKATLAEITRADRYPHGVQPNGLWQQEGSESWISGFLPGQLWIMYQLLGDESWKLAAVQRMAAIEKHKNLSNTHDLHFMVGIPFLRAFEATGNAAYRDVVIQTARTLATRFRPKVGIIDSWEWGRYNNTTETIIDNMMNLETIFWAEQQETGEQAWWDLAVAHANTTMNNFFCDNGAVTHIVHFDPETAEVTERERDCTIYPEEELFARGHGWAIYGYAMAYRFTGDERYIDQAHQTLQFYLQAADINGISAWSLVPGTPGSDAPDSTAAAITAAALFEMSVLATSEERQAEYWLQGCRLLENLLSPDYLTDGPGNGILYHGTSGVTSRIDTALSYGDYYLLEAVERYLALKEHIINAR